MESQIEAAESRRIQSAPRVSAEELDRQRKLENLMLSRKRIAADLERASHPRHREMLEAALAHLDRQIADFTA